MMKRLTLLGLAAVLGAGTALAQSSDFAAFQAPLSSSSENPPVEDADLSGSALVIIQTTRDSADALSRAVVGFYVDLDSEAAATITNMHIHEGAATEIGPVVIDSLFGSAVDLEPGASQIFRETTVTSEEGLAAIQALVSNPGGFYVNLHSMANPDGAARGQLQPVDFSSDDGQGGPSNSELSSQLSEMQETLGRIARRLGVVPAGETGSGEGEQ